MDRTIDGLLRRDMRHLRDAVKEAQMAGCDVLTVARMIGEEQARLFNDYGATDKLFTMLDSASGTEIINPFTSVCARFEFSYDQAIEEYGEEFVSAWARKAASFYISFGIYN